MNIELIGERLKKIRQEKGLTLDDLQKKTRVHLNILKAIEGETLTNLSPVYLKGFVKIYCRALGLDPKDYMPDCKEMFPKVVLRPPQEGGGGSFLKNVAVKMRLLKPGKKLRKIILIVLGIIVVFMLFSKISGCLSGRRNLAPDSAQDYVKKQPLIQGANIPQAGETRIPKEASGGIRLLVSAKENCLISVKSDGRVVFHRVLERGRSNNWKAKEKIELSLGNASAVEITINGQRFTNLGRKGQPLRNIVITEKDGLRMPR